MAWSAGASGPAFAGAMVEVFLSNGAAQNSRHAALTTNEPTAHHIPWPVRPARAAPGLPQAGRLATLQGEQPLDVVAPSTT